MEKWERPSASARAPQRFPVSSMSGSLKAPGPALALVRGRDLVSKHRFPDCVPDYFRPGCVSIVLVSDCFQLQGGGVVVSCASGRCQCVFVLSQVRGAAGAMSSGRSESYSEQRAKPTADCSLLTAHLRQHRLTFDSTDAQELPMSPVVRQKLASSGTAVGPCTFGLGLGLGLDDGVRHGVGPCTCARRGKGGQPGRSWMG
jgi:hypothetical protein